MTDRIWDRYPPGQVISRGGENEQLLVLGFDEEQQRYNVMRLPKGGGQIRWAMPAELQGWESVYLGGPRFVQVRRKGQTKVEWSTYLPDFISAVSLYREMELCDDPQFEVEVHYQHPDEAEVLDGYGYFKPVEG